MAKTKRAAVLWTNATGPEMPGMPLPPLTQAAPDAELLDAYSRAVIEVVERTGPAVVSISVGAAGRGDEIEPAGAGSGFVITPDGYVLTNCHVVQGAPRIDVTFVNGDRRKAALVGLDESTDLAVVCVNASGLPFVSLGVSSGLRVVRPGLAAAPAAVRQ